jgi:hypothetical protein
VTEISQDDARKLLGQAHHPATNPDLYGAERRAGGWVFSWRRDAGSVPIGSMPVVVGDSGRFRTMVMTDRVDALLAELQAEPPR